ncbi:NAD(P)/FAD-dependent oxidoreductase [Bacillus sp. FJAT-47783]|uniref:NAD(P)/FAD-dependent oxidoreductase n=1 Tax=Bacillus sp. FJAT-47783 TaxID=2922712 RepID=UPI001FAD54F5|nr:NAD(P)/FAD-dependent oxidoreductase [Bacillus sp. FJAT-47783]
MTFDCIIIGGGIAGLQAAIQLGRYCHNIVVIDTGFGRSTLCRMYHNILGWPNGIDGQALRQLGREHAEKYGVTFHTDRVVNLYKEGHGFTVQTERNYTYFCKTVLFATGVMDRIPSFLHNQFKPFLGKSIYVCPDCDGYEVRGQKTIVIGSGDSGANMALTLTYWTDNLLFVNHEKKEVNASLQKSLHQHNIPIISKGVQKIISSPSTAFRGVLLEDETSIEGSKGFIAFGGNHVSSQLAVSLGVHVQKNNHIIVDERTKETNIRNVWAAGDVVAHSEQVTIAMGEGSQSAIWIHKRLMELNA